MMTSRLVRTLASIALLTCGFSILRFSTLSAMVVEPPRPESTTPISIDPDQDNFEFRVINNYEQLNRTQKKFDASEYKKVKVGTSLFVPISHIHPTQNRYAFLFALERISIDTPKFASMNGRNLLQLKEDHNQSLYPIAKAKPVVLSNEGLLIVDGHHSIFAAAYVGATTMPVEIKADWTNLSQQDLWKKMEASGYAYLQSMDGRKHIPSPHFSDMEEDPYRYLASMVINEIVTDGKVDVKNPVGTKYPVAIKVNIGVPFIEFHMVDVIRKANIEVSVDDMKNKSLPDVVVERIRSALLASKANNNPFLAGLDLVNQSISNEDIKAALSQFSMSQEMKGRENTLKELYRDINLDYIDYAKVK